MAYKAKHEIKRRCKKTEVYEKSSKQMFPESKDLRKYAFF